MNVQDNITGSLCEREVRSGRWCGKVNTCLGGEDLRLVSWTRMTEDATRRTTQNAISELEKKLAELKKSSGLEGADEAPIAALPVPQAPVAGTLPVNPLAAAAMAPSVANDILQAKLGGNQKLALPAGSDTGTNVNPKRDSPRSDIGASASQVGSATGTEGAKNLKRDAVVITQGSEENAAKVARLMLTQPELTTFRDFIGALTAAESADQLNEIANG